MTAKTSYDDYYKNQDNYGYTHNTMGFGQSSTRFEEYNYWEGILMIDIFEFNQKTLVWQSAKSGILTEVKSAQERQERISLLVSDMFNDFPIAVIQE